MAQKYKPKRHEDDYNPNRAIVSEDLPFISESTELSSRDTGQVIKELSFSGVGLTARVVILETQVAALNAEPHIEDMVCHNGHFVFHLNEPVVHY